MILPPQPRPNYPVVKVFGVIVPLGVIIAFASMTLSPEEKEQAEKVRIQEFAATNPQVRMRLTDFSWEAGGFGTVLLNDFTIVNGNTFAVKDITISCVLQGPSGTVVGTTKHAVYDVVLAHSAKRFEKVNMGFINSQTYIVSCAVNGASVF